MDWPLIRQYVTGWVFPPSCEICQSPLETRRQLTRPFLCEGCEASLSPLSDDYCRRCGQDYESPLFNNATCANCGGRDLAFDFAVSALRSRGVARELMHAFKYRRGLHLARLFGILLDEVWRDARLRQVQWLVVPVPLHPKRLRDRGFNQAAELAHELVCRAPRDVSLTMRPILKRTCHTVRQASLDRADRLSNLQGVFALRRGMERHLGEGGSVLLVDDVMTTGTTASECAAVLRGAGEVEQIAAVSVLRG